jgi:hypothetical protein
MELHGSVFTPSPCALPPRSRRQELLPERKQLPVWAAQERLLALVQESRALVLVGETGSGKTTQIPQFLLHGGFASTGAIAITQPRRVAAMSVARRVAEEVGTTLGHKVGLRVYGQEGGGFRGASRECCAGEVSGGRGLKATCAHSHHSLILTDPGSDPDSDSGSRPWL